MRENTILLILQAYMEMERLVADITSVFEEIGPSDVATV